MLFLIKQCHSANPDDPDDAWDRRFELLNYVTWASLHKVHSRIAYHSAAASGKAVGDFPYDDIGYLLARAEGWKKKLLEAVGSLEELDKGAFEFLKRKLEGMNVPESMLRLAWWEQNTTNDEDLRAVCRMRGAFILADTQETIQTAAGRSRVIPSAYWPSVRVC